MNKLENITLTLNNSIICLQSNNRKYYYKFASNIRTILHNYHFSGKPSKDKTLFVGVCVCLSVCPSISMLFFESSIITRMILCSLYSKWFQGFKPRTSCSVAATLFSAHVSNIKYIIYEKLYLEFIWRLQVMSKWKYLVLISE